RCNRRADTGDAALVVVPAEQRELRSRRVIEKATLERLARFEAELQVFDRTRGTARETGFFHQAHDPCSRWIALPVALARALEEIVDAPRYHCVRLETDHEQPAAGCEHAKRLADEAGRIRKMMQRVVAPHEVERGVHPGQPLGAAEHELG